MRILLLWGILLCHILYAEEEGGRLYCESDSLTVSVFSQCTLSLWPVPKGSLEVFKELEKTRQFESLFIHKVENVSRNSNNYDVVDILVTVVPFGDKWSEKNLYLELKKEFIPFRSNVKVISGSEDISRQLIQDGPIFLPTGKFSKDWTMWIVGILLGSLAIGSGIYLGKKYKKRKQGLSEEEKFQQNFKKALEEAIDRESIERLYQFKDGPIFNLVQAEHWGQFSGQLNSIQYQEEWDEQELDLMKKQIEKLKRGQHANV